MRRIFYGQASTPSQPPWPLLPLSPLLACQPAPTTSRHEACPAKASTDYVLVRWYPRRFNCTKSPDLTGHGSISPSVWPPPHPSISHLPHLPSAISREHGYGATLQSAWPDLLRVSVRFNQASTRRMATHPATCHRRGVARQQPTY